MLYYCAFTWYPTTTRQKVAERLVRQHDAGLNHPERIQGWYNLAGGGSGFLLVEHDLMSWDVRAVYERQYNDAEIESLRQVAKQTG